MPGRVIALRISTDGTRIGAIDDLYNVRIWRLKDGGEELTSTVCRTSRPVAESPATLASFSADLNRAVIVNNVEEIQFGDVLWNHVVWLWEATKEPRILGKKLGYDISCAAMSPDEFRLIAIDAGYSTSIYDFATAKELKWSFAMFEFNYYCGNPGANLRDALSR